MPHKWWLLIDPLEVVPVGDTREHETGLGCWCGPEEDDGVVVHNAADKREDYETGRRKPN